MAPEGPAMPIGENSGESPENFAFPPEHQSVPDPEASEMAELAEEAERVATDLDAQDKREHERPKTYVADDVLGDNDKSRGFHDPLTASTEYDAMFTNLAETHRARQDMDIGLANAKNAADIWLTVDTFEKNHPDQMPFKADAVAAYMAERVWQGDATTTLPADQALQGALQNFEKKFVDGAGILNDPKAVKDVQNSITDAQNINELILVAIKNAGLGDSKTGRVYSLSDLSEALVRCGQEGASVHDAKKLPKVLGLQEKAMALIEQSSKNAPKTSFAEQTMAQQLESGDFTGSSNVDMEEVAKTPFALEDWAWPDLKKQRELVELWKRLMEIYSYGGIQTVDLDVEATVTTKQDIKELKAEQKADTDPKDDNTVDAWQQALNKEEATEESELSSSGAKTSQPKQPLESRVQVTETPEADTEHYPEKQSRLKSLAKFTGVVAGQAVMNVLGVKAAADWSRAVAYGAGKLMGAKQDSLYMRMAGTGDVVAYFKDFSERRHMRDELLSVMLAKEGEQTGERREPLAKAVARVEARIKSSNQEQRYKDEGLFQLQRIVERYDGACGKSAKEAKKNVAEVFSGYVNNKVTKIKLARDMLNTALVGTGFGFYRGVGYGASVMMERANKAWEKYSHERDIVENFGHEHGRFSFIMRDMTLTAAKEQFKGMTGFGGARNFVDSWAKLGTFAGITSTMSANESIHGILAHIEKGDFAVSPVEAVRGMTPASVIEYVKQGGRSFVDHFSGQNFVINAERAGQGYARMWEAAKHAPELFAAGTVDVSTLVSGAAPKTPSQTLEFRQTITAAQGPKPLVPLAETQDMDFAVPKNTSDTGGVTVAKSSPTTFETTTTTTDDGMGMKVTMIADARARGSATAYVETGVDSGRTVPDDVFKTLPMYKVKGQSYRLYDADGDGNPDLILNNHNELATNVTEVQAKVLATHKLFEEFKATQAAMSGRRDSRVFELYNNSGQADRLTKDELGYVQRSLYLFKGLSSPKEDLARNPAALISFTERQQAVLHELDTQGGFLSVRNADLASGVNHPTIWVRDMSTGEVFPGKIDNDHFKAIPKDVVFQELRAEDPFSTGLVVRKSGQVVFRGDVYESGGKIFFQSNDKSLPVNGKHIGYNSFADQLRKLPQPAVVGVSPEVVGDAGTKFLNNTDILVAEGQTAFFRPNGATGTITRFEVPKDFAIEEIPNMGTQSAYTANNEFRINYLDKTMGQARTLPVATGRFKVEGDTAYVVIKDLTGNGERQVKWEDFATNLLVLRYNVVGGRVVSDFFTDWGFSNHKTAESVLQGNGDRLAVDPANKTDMFFKDTPTSKAVYLDMPANWQFSELDASNRLNAGFKLDYLHDRSSVGMLNERFNVVENGQMFKENGKLMVRFVLNNNLIGTDKTQYVLPWNKFLHVYNTHVSSLKNLAPHASREGIMKDIASQLIKAANKK